MTVNFLPAAYGDCIWISFPDTDGAVKNILIDGGTSDTYLLEKNSKGKSEDGALKELIETLGRKGQRIDLLVITHVDDDHIAGVLKWFEEDPAAHQLIGEVWFNSGKIIAEGLKARENADLRQPLKPTGGLKTSIGQGMEFSQYLHDHVPGNRQLILQGEEHKRFGLTFKILSPNKPKLSLLLKHWKKKDPDLKTATAVSDYAKSLKDHIAADSYVQDSAYPNGSSIAFILTYRSQNLLFLGDAHSSVIIKGLKIFNYTPEKPLKTALVKLSHHGSKGNNSVKLLNCLDSDIFVISTDGSVNQHPHKQMLARLINIKPGSKLVFNYKARMEAIFSIQDRLNFPYFTTEYAPQGLTIAP